MENSSTNLLLDLANRATPFRGTIGVKEEYLLVRAWLEVVRGDFKY